MPLTSTINFGVSGTHTSALDLGTASLPFSLANNFTLATGTGASQADLVFTDTRTLAASGTEDLDLAGVLTNAFGTLITFAKIKGLFITALAANTNDVVLSRPAANGVPLFSAASDAIAIKPGGLFGWACPGTGVTVTAATGDLITITNSAGGTGVTYSIVIIGTSV